MQQETRDRLIDIVTNTELTIKEAAIKLNINYSTAKHIIKQHKLGNQDE